MQLKRILTSSLFKATMYVVENQLNYIIAFLNFNTY